MYLGLESVAVAILVLARVALLLLVDAVDTSFRLDLVRLLFNALELSILDLADLVDDASDDNDEFEVDFFRFRIAFSL